MFDRIFNLLYSILHSLVNNTVVLISNLFGSVFEGPEELIGIDFNLVLFSETPIFTMSIYDLLVLFFTIFYSMFFIILLYKATKKFINMIFGVFRL